MRFIYVRHGETDWNRAGLIQGSSDIPLNERGREQAHITADLLKDIHIDRIYCSPLQRAVETASIINSDRQVPLTPDIRLHERRMGDLEGLTYEPEDFVLWAKTYYDCSIHGVEPNEKLFERVYGLIEELKAAYPDDTILIVAHGGLYIVFDSYFNGYPDDNSAVSIVPNCTYKLYEV